MTKEISPWFLLNCKRAIEDMKRHGMNSTIIACVINEIRSVTLNEEYYRLTELLRLNPPDHRPSREIQDILDVHYK